MSREKRPYTPYQPMPASSRFWLHAEACYTEAELEFRSWVLNARTNSGIHTDYLSNPSSWFADDQQALVNVYERSWFFSNTFKPRHVLTLDDFYVQPVDTQRLQWPQLYEVMQQIGDYLLTRNRNLRSEHLNQPMNYVLLDLNNMLKGISQNPNIEQTQAQLRSVTRYMRNIEKHTSALVGSDRIFLANMRSSIDEDLQPKLSLLIDSKLLKDRLAEVLKTVKQVADERHRIVHFALSSGEVNAHPYDFSLIPTENLKAYPALAAKACASKSTTVATAGGYAPAVKLSAEQLRLCPEISLITASSEAWEHYAKSVSDLSQLTQFQEVIQQVIDLLGQAGEVYTIYQFKAQLLELLGRVEHFIDKSTLTTQGLIRENTKAYHKALLDEQNLSVFSRMFSKGKERLSHFIKNQDILSQFPSTPADLLTTNSVLKKQLSQVVSHLNRPSLKETSFSALAQQSQQLNLLMGSMHQLTYEIQGLEVPQVAENVGLLAPPDRELTQSHHRFFGTTSLEMPVVSGQCTDSDCPAQSSNAIYIIGLVALIPIGLITLYLLFKSQEKTVQPEKESTLRVLGTKEEYEESKERLEDLIAQNKDKYNKDHHAKVTYDELIEDYEELETHALAGEYRVGDLNELYNDLQQFFADYVENSIRLS